jgi:hypothetical protein
MKLQRLPNTTDMAVLIHNLYRGAAHPDVGYLDSLLPLDALVDTFNFDIPYRLDKLEKSLFMANMLNEQNDFWHPEGMPFSTWVWRFTPRGYEFDTRYNYFRERSSK